MYPISLEEIPVDRIEEFWAVHFPYLVTDGIVTDEEDLEYFGSGEYRDVIKAHMLRPIDRHHMLWFVRGDTRIGAAQYNTYHSEDGKCFILDFWVFPEYRGAGTGHRCFEALKAHTQAAGARYYELNCTKENAHRFWTSLGFTDCGLDEYDMPLLRLHPVELWDLYDENRTPTGLTHIRGRELPPDRYHLVVHVWIRNRQGKYLISQRNANRPTYPLLWECVGGSVVAGEDSLTGALREAKEEVGVDLEPRNGRVVCSKTRNFVDGLRFGDILDVWLFDYDGEVDLRAATTDEVAQSRWLTGEEVRALYEAGKLVPTLEYFFEKVDVI